MYSSVYNIRCIKCKYVLVMYKSACINDSVDIGFHTTRPCLQLRGIHWLIYMRLSIIPYCITQALLLPK